MIFESYHDVSVLKRYSINLALDTTHQEHLMTRASAQQHFLHAKQQAQAITHLVYIFFPHNALQCTGYLCSSPSPTHAYKSKTIGKLIFRGQLTAISCSPALLVALLAQEDTSNTAYVAEVNA